MAGRQERAAEQTRAARDAGPGGLAPGTPLRDGLERILRGNTGALIVLGDKTVESICTGGFVLDVEFSATRLRELCKMDGGVVLDRDARASCGPACSSYPTRRSRPSRPAPDTAPPSGSTGRPAFRSSQSASRCG